MEKPDSASSPVLSSKQIKYLRGLGHGLSPLVLIGKEGISDNLLKAIQSELKTHELIKVKIGTNSPVDKNEAAERIPPAAAAALVQFIGKTLLLYRANPKKPKDKRIALPKI
ncbi:MAG: ribosome assembly RNA-binding protein YhbY [Desulfopila sp.]|jgi:RNA-binding protein|nr:ribosome assembly RNA-binding protein YhbY [Desulfopila sp.]